MVALRVVIATIVVLASTKVDAAAQRRSAKSGIGEWVDPDTPEDHQTYFTSRGEQWQLVMSDEFNTPERDFRPGKDHMWTSLQKPDGVNGGLELYSHEMATTTCDLEEDDGDGSCFFQIEIADEKTTHTVFNAETNPAGWETVTMNYKSAMVQTWNKFCLQGGMIEVRSRLPGITSKLNPDVHNNSRSQRLRNTTFYPTWPGIWLYGNLGRATFTASNDRMWPFSYSHCNETVFSSSNQRISACNAHPGHGLNPFQGRGAPEIDIVEAAGTKISSSLQIAPGMPKKFRKIEVNKDLEGEGLICAGSCKTPGANVMGIPTKLYNERGFRTWYQGLRYAANNFCDADATKAQNYTELVATITKGITDNKCPDDTDKRINVCPASHDFYADFGTITVGNKDNDHWNVNSNGTCFAMQNTYTGTFLCSRNNIECQTEEELAKGLQPLDSPFAYQMDVISANWGMHMAGYVDYVDFQVEWVTGEDGYIRWSLHGQPIFEIPGASLTNPPQDPAELNPRKLVPEEPMYLIINAALSTSWSSTPPNAPRGCRDSDPDHPPPKWQENFNNQLCDEFPLFMRIDHVRVYQDLSSSSRMSLGCDPKTHPTKKWIEDHLDEYTDEDNPNLKVVGGANCHSDDDCTVASSKVVTGTCVHHRCKCVSPFWEGPRCIRQVGTNDDGDSSQAAPVNRWEFTNKSFSPSPVVAGVFAGLVLMVTLYAAVRRYRQATELLVRERRLTRSYSRPQLAEMPRKSGERHSQTAFIDDEDSWLYVLSE